MQISNEVLMLGQIDELKKQNKSLQKENQILREMLLDEMNKKVQAGKKAKRIIEELRGENKWNLKSNLEK